MFQRMQREIDSLRAQQQSGAAGGALGMPKFPTPMPYDGVGGDVRSFLTQAKAYLLVNQTINTPTGKILCIGNLLSGKAFEWWEPTLRDFLDNESDANRDEETNEIFRSYESFEEKLKNAFGDPDEERTATRQLKNLRQTGSAMHYNREFRRFSSKLDLGDNAMMEYFYDGLREDVKDELSKQDRPDDFDDFVNMAIKIDNRNYQRRLEKGRKGGDFRPSHRPNQGKSYRHRSTAYGHHSGPMELDAAQRDSKPKGKCYNCGKEGHYANKCRSPKKKNFVPLPERKAHEATRGNTRSLQEVRRICDNNCPRVTINEPPRTNRDWVAPRAPTPRPIRPTTETEVVRHHAFRLTAPQYKEVYDQFQKSNPSRRMCLPVYGIYTSTHSQEIELMQISLNANEFRQLPRSREHSSIHPTAEQHHEVAWVQCFTHACQDHFLAKSQHGIFPKRPHNILIVQPILEVEIEDWHTVQPYFEGDSHENWHILCNPQRHHEEVRTEPNSPRIPEEPDEGLVQPLNQVYFTSEEDYVRANKRQIQWWCRDQSLSQIREQREVELYMSRLPEWRGQLSSENDYTR